MIAPLITNNVVVRYDEKKIANRQTRWQKIAEEAAKQCGRSKIPQVMYIMSLTNFLANKEIITDNTRLIFCYEGEKQQGLKQVLSKINVEKYKRIVLIVGAEGGFTMDEVATIINAGGTSVTIGKRILRAETAAIVGTGIVQYELGDLS